MNSVGFPAGDGNVRFRLEPTWNHALTSLTGSSPVEAYIRIGKGIAAQELQLTKDALLEATSLIGLTKGYVTKSPAELIQPQLDYWFGEGLDKEYQVLTRNGNLGQAFIRGTIVPFSNLRLLEEATDAIRSRYGRDTEIVADAKFTHSLKKTHLRLIVPEKSRVMVNTGTDDDLWSVGLRIRNSITGAEQTSLDGYLFRYFCTNGSIDTAASSGAWSRRGEKGSKPEEVYTWARAVMGDVLDGLEHSLEKIQALTDISVEGEVQDVLHDVFRDYMIPGPIRSKVVQNMAEESNLTMYSIMNAITEVANDSEMDPAHVEQLMVAGGNLANTEHERCESCHHLVRA